jgi:hypothetical protein
MFPEVMTILEVHIGKPLQQLLPVVPALLLALLDRFPVVDVSPIFEPVVFDGPAPLAVPSFLLRPPPVVQPEVLHPPVEPVVQREVLHAPFEPVVQPQGFHPRFEPVVPVLFRNLRFVKCFGSGRKVIMNFLFNRLLRRKPPLYGVEGAPRGAPVRGVLLLPGHSVVSRGYPIPVIVTSVVGYPVGVRMGVTLSFDVIVILTVSVYSLSSPRVRRMKCGCCHTRINISTSNRARSVNHRQNIQTCKPPRLLQNKSTVTFVLAKLKSVKI